MSKYQLAQINVATLKAPLDSPELKDFVDNLDRINELAEQSQGFVWRLKGDGNDATSLRPLGDNVLVNMSVWRDVDALRAGIREGAVAMLLFPEDPVASAPKILDRLALVFPPQPGATSAVTIPTCRRASRAPCRRPLVPASAPVAAGRFRRSIHGASAVSCPRSMTQRQLDGLEKFVRSEGLLDQADGLERGRMIAGIWGGRDQYHWDGGQVAVRQVLLLGAELPPVDDRHVEIEEHQVRYMLAEGRHRVSTVERFDYVVSLALEKCRSYLSTVGVIVHNQYERILRSTHSTGVIHVTAWLCPAFCEEDGRKVRGNVVDETRLKLIEDNAVDRACRLLLYSKAHRRIPPG